MGLVWINMVGAYGVASAQFYWGGMAGLILRPLYNIAPEDASDPEFWRRLIVYVDDPLAFPHLSIIWGEANVILISPQLSGAPITYGKVHI